jgi:hypothetical protein
MNLLLQSHASGPSVKLFRRRNPSKTIYTLQVANSMPFGKFWGYLTYIKVWGNFSPSEAFTCHQILRKIVALYSAILLIN